MASCLVERSLERDWWYVEQARRVYRKMSFGEMASPQGIAVLASTLLGDGCIRYVPTVSPGRAVISNLGRRWEICVRGDVPATTLTIAIARGVARWALATSVVDSGLDEALLAEHLLVPAPAIYVAHRLLGLSVAELCAWFVADEEIIRAQLATTSGEALGETAVVVHADGDAISGANGQALDVLGCTLPELAGHSLLESRWKTTDDQGEPVPLHAHPITTTLRTGEPQDGVHLRLARCAGGDALVSLSTRSTDAGLLVFFEELAHERRLASGLQPSLAARGDAIVLQDPRGQILFANDHAQELLGLTLDQMKGVTSLDPRWHVTHPDGRPFPGHTHPSMVTLRTGAPQRDVPMVVHRTDGMEIRMSVTTLPSPDGGVTCVFHEAREAHRLTG